MFDVLLVHSLGYRIRKQLYGLSPWYEFGSFGVNVKLLKGMQSFWYIWLDIQGLLLEEVYVHDDIWTHHLLEWEFVGLDSFDGQDINSIILTLLKGVGSIFLRGE